MPLFELVCGFVMVRSADCVLMGTLMLEYVTGGGDGVSLGLKNAF